MYFVQLHAFLLLVTAAVVTCTNCKASGGKPDLCCGFSSTGGPSKDLQVTCTVDEGTVVKGQALVAGLYSGYQSNCCCCGPDNQVDEDTDQDTDNDVQTFNTNKPVSDVCKNPTPYNDGKSPNGNLFWCLPGTSPGAGGDPHFSGFDGTQFDVKGKDGLNYNLLTETDHVVNARFAQVKPVLVENLWMTEIGIVLTNNITVAVFLQLDNYTAAFQETFEVSDRVGRMLYSNVQSIVKVQVNGDDATAMLESRGHLRLADKHDLTVYFPAEKHANDPTDGPLIVVRTPKFEIQVLLETEGMLHLDFSVRRMTSAHGDMHGLIGQTVNWNGAGANNYIQGSEDDYVVPSLLATEYEFSRFGKQVIRRTLVEGSGVTAAGYEAGSVHV